ncbi:MAG: biopolymer transporter ExbD [Pirellulaceae bacterium]|nr:biopolymer transporter ExbD [Pirellulaceae bacterium]
MKVNTYGGFQRLFFNMTPMIDVCFQLIIFFMLTLRLFSPEGDFGITMPLALPSSGNPPMIEPTPVKIRLTAYPDGKLSGIQLGQRSMNSFAHLHEQVREVSNMQSGPAGAGTEVELDCDYNLKFRYIVAALNAVTGYVANDKETIVRLIDKIKFAPPRKPENKTDGDTAPPAEPPAE